MDLKKEQLLDMYKKMVTIRAFELKAVDLFAAGLIPGFVHLYSRVRKPLLPAYAPIWKRRTISRQYPSGTWSFDSQKGGDTKINCMAELFGRTTGYCKGKGIDAYCR